MTRVVSLSDEDYERLKSLKRAFPVRKKSLLDLWGKWLGGKEELAEIEKRIYEDRKKFKLGRLNSEAFALRSGSYCENPGGLRNI